MNTAFTRRGLLIAGGCTLAGCNTIASLERSATTLDTYDLAPAQMASAGARNRLTLLVLEPTAPAALATDRVLVRTSPQSVTYLPDARWVDEVPLLLQSLLIRTLSSAGQMGFVGAGDAGPVPDTVLLARIDRFDVTVAIGTDGQRSFAADIAFELTLLRDRDQSIIGSRAFAQTTALPDDTAGMIVAGFQGLIDGLLPDAVDWVGRNARA